MFSYEIVAEGKEPPSFYEAFGKKHTYEAEFPTKVHIIILLYWYDSILEETGPNKRVKCIKFLWTFWQEKITAYNRFSTKRYNKKYNISCDIRIPTIWYVRPAKALIRDFARAWLFYDCKATDQTPFGVSKPKRRLHRLLWVYTYQVSRLI